MLFARRPLLGPGDGPAGGRGVWYLTGGIHYSAAIGMMYHGSVAASPPNDDRALAVIAEVKRLVPNKPMRCEHWTPP